MTFIRSLALALFTFALTSGWTFSINIARGAEILTLGNVAPAIAVAGAYSTEVDVPALVALNPVSAASFLRPNLTVNYTGIFSNQNLFTGIYSQPTPIGVFSLAYNGLFTTSLVAGTLHGFEVLFSKEISTHFKFGMGLGLDLGSTTVLGTPYTATGIHAQLAMLYESPEVLQKTFGIGKLRLGAQVKQAGLFPFYTITNTLTTLKTIDLRGGISFDWLKLGSAVIKEGRSKDFFTSRFLLDLDVAPYPPNLTFNSALKNTFYFNGIVQSLCLSGGFFLSSTNIGVPYLGPWSAGVGLVFDFSPTDLTLQYSLVPENIGTSYSFYHSLSISVALGRKDVSKPQIELGDFKEAN